MYTLSSHFYCPRAYNPAATELATKRARCLRCVGRAFRSEDALTKAANKAARVASGSVVEIEAPNAVLSQNTHYFGPPLEHRVNNVGVLELGRTREARISGRLRDAEQPTHAAAQLTRRRQEMLSSFAASSRTATARMMGKRDYTVRGAAGSTRRSSRTAHEDKDVVRTHRKCYNCKQYGHLASVCPLITTASSVNECTPCEDGKALNRKKCYACAQYGHLAADCPLINKPSILLTDEPTALFTKCSSLEEEVAVFERARPEGSLKRYFPSTAQEEPGHRLAVFEQMASPPQSLKCLQSPEL